MMGHRRLGCADAQAEVDHRCSHMTQKAIFHGANGSYMVK